MNEKGLVTIKAIEKDVVNQICSGQVILSLATAIKELVENSIDAGASSIQIRLKEYGSEIIEVSDNGLGVQENNFQALTLKHYTSKISNFIDISLVETFGFRGEALSSLCSLSKVSIITKHRDTATGTKLKFDHNGIIVDSSKIARQTGTTVILENIFYTLPVRHKEFLRNIKKEFTKMCNVLYAYGVLSKGISIICTNQISNRKITVMETKGDTIKSNIIQIFGSKQSQHLLELKESFPEDIQDYDNSIMKIKSMQDIKLEGFVSSCVHGCGRSSSDRQYYYINSRPVDNIKIMKLVNDVYHQYNPHQYPFIVMNVKILMKFIDVNVTPDKRLIFMKDENLLLSIIKASLHNIFRTIPAVLEIQNVGLILPKADPQTVEGNRNKKTSFLISLEKLRQFKSSSSVSYDSKSKDMSVTNEKLKKHHLSSGAIAKEKFSRKIESSYLSNFCTPDENMCSDKNKKLNSSSKEDFYIVENSENNKLKEFNISYLEKDNIIINQEDAGSLEQESSTKENVLTPHKRKAFDGIKCENVQFQKEIGPSDGENLLESKNLQTVKRLKTDDGISEAFKKNRKTLAFTISFSNVQKLITNYAMKRSQNKDCSNDMIRFHTEISPQKNDIAEKELKKELSKESFKHMTVIGQFNLGFIITNLGADIFIIDQHASDEKYNFETLQLNTKIQTQKLVIPQSLNLTIEKEEIFLQHSEIIRKNGFDFVFDNNCDPTNRIKLISIPLSRNWVFGKEDIDELLFILENSPDQMCRPSRMRNMFASRACRKSVMIGTPLNNYEMKRIVNHMGEIEQPWNCPHGRPTIRHLINLNMVKKA